MKAIVYHGKKNLSVEEVDIPAIGPDEVLIRVKYCGICGTDIHIYNGDGGSYDVEAPRILGHEFSGFVESVGPLVTSVKVGDLVSVDPNAMCGECYFCKAGKAHFCTKALAYGVTANGGFAEYAAARESAVYKYKDGVDPLAAAATEPLSCCLHGIDLCGVKAGDEVVVIGGGPIGMTMLQLAKSSGVSKAILIEPVASKRALAKKLGADIALDPTQTDIAAYLGEHCNNVDLVIECVGNPAIIEDAISWAGMGATVMMFGLTGPDAKIAVKPDDIFKKELKLTSSFINPYAFGRAVALIESGNINVASLVGAIVGLDEAIEAFEDSSLRSGGKVLVRVY
ncbi:MAG: zinc-dependent alcohol dehydrogenase family protein [Clostridiales Family XIII bacterium]|jgi:2-desacetyl-2-hydroxyethyl bacteriochlorophyllide A dehydrogenase|nr:zinc-dependent alcohol dehydrogenase family protein [Clostridiales Family XIII bacterium]